MLFTQKKVFTVSVKLVAIQTVFGVTNFGNHCFFLSEIHIWQSLEVVHDC